MLEPILDTLSSKKIVLGSTSTSRAALLTELGLQFEVVKPTYNDELSLNWKFSSKYSFVKDVAYKKLISVESYMSEHDIKADIIITAYTALFHKDIIYGKPESPEDIVGDLKELNGKTHEVFTSACFKAEGRLFIFAEKVNVCLADLPISTIKAYAQTGESVGKIGGYGFYGKGGSFIKHINGQISTALGLPIYNLCSHILRVYPIPQEEE